eukprot:3440983-Pyramimonas_sp.AAC.1
MFRATYVPSTVYTKVYKKSYLHKVYLQKVYLHKVYTTPREAGPPSCPAQGLVPCSRPPRTPAGVPFPTQQSTQSSPETAPRPRWVLGCSRGRP